MKSLESYWPAFEAQFASDTDLRGMAPNARAAFKLWCQRRIRAVQAPAMARRNTGAVAKPWTPRTWRAGETLALNDLRYRATRDTSVPPWKSLRAWERVQ